MGVIVKKAQITDKTVKIGGKKYVYQYLSLYLNTSDILLLWGNEDKMSREVYVLVSTRPIENIVDMCLEAILEIREIRNMINRTNIDAETRSQILKKLVKIEEILRSIVLPQRSEK